MSDTTDIRAAAEEALRLHEAVKPKPCSPSCPGCNGRAGWPCPLAEKARVDMQRRKRDLLPILARAVIEGQREQAADMAAPNGPVCACGAPSAHESGWCGKSHLHTPPRPAPLTEGERKAWGRYVQAVDSIATMMMTPDATEERIRVVGAEYDSALAHLRTFGCDPDAYELPASRRAIPLEVRPTTEGT